jgi:hypothetical protein
MKIAITLATVAGLLVPASPALAAPAAGPGHTDTPGPTAAAAARPGGAPTTPDGAAAPGAAPGQGAAPQAGGAGQADAPQAGAVAQTGGAVAQTGGAVAQTGGAVALAGGAAQPDAEIVPALVARWDFNAGPVGGKVADTSGRAPALAVRAADQGVIRFEGPTGGRYVAFPAACATGATVCPRGLLEAADDADLNPGTRLFRWSAKVQLTRAQLRGSANVMQKGVAGTGSLWKLQVGATQGRAQCVLAGAGSSTPYIARSTRSVADGAWHKVLCQRSGATLSVFVDGVAGGQTAIPSALSITNALPLRLGGPNFNTRSDMYHGNLDDVYAELG